MLAARADGHSVTTLEGLQEEAKEFGAFIADQGAEQCGFCNPGFIMNALALFREKEFPEENEIREYLAEKNRRRRQNESSQYFCTKKRCDAAGNRTAGLRG